MLTTPVNEARAPWIRSIADAARPSRFMNNVLMLAGGTTLAQFIGVALAPVLTRLFSPDDFGILAIQTSMIAIVLTCASGRYEVAIPLARSREEATNVAAVAAVLLGCSTAVAFAALLLFQSRIAAALHLHHLGLLLWTVPIGMVASGGYEILTYAGIRLGDFKALVYSKLLQTIAQCGAQIGFGYAGFGAAALAGGDVGGRGAGTTGFAVAIIRKRVALLDAISFAGMRDAARQWKRFPLIFSGSTLINTANVQIVPLLIAALFTPKVAGLYSLGYRVLFLPMSLIGQSVAQVFYSEASRLHQQNSPALRGLVRRLAAQLFAFAIIPAVVIAAGGPRLFSLVFGKQWIEAGEIARILVVVFVVQFVYSPISQLFNIFGRQDVHFWWSAVLLASSVISLEVGSRYLSVHSAFLIFAAANAAAYAVAIAVFFRWLVPAGRVTP